MEVSGEGVLLALSIRVCEVRAVIDKQPKEPDYDAAALSEEWDEEDGGDPPVLTQEQRDIEASWCHGPAPDDALEDDPPTVH